MKCVIIFAVLLAFASARSLKPCIKPPAIEEEPTAPETPAPVEADVTTVLPVERFGEEPSATTLADEEFTPTTYAPLLDTVAPTVVFEELPATTEVSVEERISETVAPTEVAEELIATTLAPVSETVAPTVVVEELTAAPETIAPPLVDPTPGLRTPDVSEEPSAVTPTVVEPLKEEEPAKPEESAIIEEPKPEEPKKLSRLITFTFYDHNSKATSLKHFLEYLRSLKK